MVVRWQAVVSPARMVVAPDKPSVLDLTVALLQVAP
jgi:hypothetical protein